VAQPPSNPRVTVLIATYNQASYLRQALDSLRAQTISPEAFEVIVINDGCTDTTSHILRDYQPWARIVERDNRGLVPSCNEGLAMARGQYFARVDSDDVVASRWLEALLEPLEHDPGACCAFSDRYELRGELKEYRPADSGNLYSLEACGVLIRTHALTAVGGFRPFFWEEYDLYLRLFKVGRFRHVPEPLYLYRKHTQAMTSHPAKRMQGWIELARVWGIETLRTAGAHPELDEALRQLAR
jgi:glycosyltransferase involved in cell wall biosynthesis